MWLSLPIPALQLSLAWFTSLAITSRHQQHRNTLHLSHSLCHFPFCHSISIPLTFSFNIVYIHSQYKGQKFFLPLRHLWIIRVKQKEREKKEGTRSRAKRMIIAIRAFDFHRGDGKGWRSDCLGNTMRCNQARNQTLLYKKTQAGNPSPYRLHA